MSNHVQMKLRPRDQFLETNGLGGFSCGTVGGLRQWPSHAMVVVAKKPPIDRYVLVNGFEVWVDFEGQSVPISVNRFPGERLEPDGSKALVNFETKPWPLWTYDLGRGRVIQFECFARHGANQFVFAWRLEVSPDPVILRVSPLISGRPVGSTRKESSHLELKPESPSARHFVWRMRHGAPDLVIRADGDFIPKPRWVRDHVYDNQSTEDLAVPGEFRWELAPRTRANLIISTVEDESEDPRTASEVSHLAHKLGNAERTRRKLFRSELDRAADQYIVEGADGKTVISGFPRGTEMGARAMIALRGICLGPGRLDMASAVLKTWRGRLAMGMLPAEISEHRLAPAYGSPEPSLWYIVAGYEYLRATARQGRRPKPEEREELEASFFQILTAFREHRHKEAFMDEDALIAETDGALTEGRPNAKVKRVHIQTLWITGLWIVAGMDPAWEEIYRAARREFDRAFWSEEKGYLYKTVVHEPNAAVRRNSALGMEQVLAVGGLPLVCVDEGKASLIVQALEDEYANPELIRAAVTFPWYFGPFIEAWYRVRFREKNVLQEVKERFVEPWQSLLKLGGLNHLSEDQPFVARGEMPINPKHAMFSATETAELFRILHLPDLQHGGHPFDETFRPVA